MRLLTEKRAPVLIFQPFPFDNPDWLFEIKHDGFRALAAIEGHTCRRVSRRGHVFSKFGLLAEELGPRPRNVRSASAQVIISNDVAYVIDCGDGVARQLSLAGFPSTRSVIFSSRISIRITTLATGT